MVWQHPLFFIATSKTPIRRVAKKILKKMENLGNSLAVLRILYIDAFLIIKKR